MTLSNSEVSDFIPASGSWCQAVVTSVPFGNIDTSMFLSEISPHMHLKKNLII